MNSRRTALLVSLALLAGSALAAKLPFAAAQSSAETNVILIQVDGLEPKDVTRENTPFLWELAHPTANSPAVGSGRAGWIWEAPRAAMTAGTAANTAALLTGGYPEVTGIPADEFTDPISGERYRLEHNPMDGVTQIYDELMDADSLLKVLPNSEGPKRLSAAFVGNPALSAMVNIEDIPPALKWWPDSSQPSDSPPSPAYCDLPRRVPDDENYRPPCSAPDATTLNRALTALNGRGGSDVALTYIHLAELGVIKRRDGDISEPPSTELSSPAAEDSIPHALAQTDAAIAQFIGRYRDATQSPTTADKWANTFVMVIGSHGYETTPITNRVPGGADGGTDAEQQDLETYVEKDNSLEYVPYGSMATIYAKSREPEAARAAIQGIAAKLQDGGVVESHDLCQDKCIKEVLYMRDDLLPDDVRADEEQRKRQLLREAHPEFPGSPISGWHLDHLSRDEPFAPTRLSGDLLVVTEPGWSAGRAIPTQADAGDDIGLLPVTDSSDPYLGAAGGPRNRAVAAIVHGPAGEQGVLQVTPDRYPVTTGPDTGELDETPDARYETLHQANAHPEDDANLPGHERQPETVDFAPTIAALLGIGIDSEQLSGRFLQEAFRRKLAFPQPELPPQDEEPPPPPPVEVVETAPEVIVLPPPPPPPPPAVPPTWKYDGLLGRLKAAVGDKNGRVFPDVRPGADLSYLILRADFGKPLAAVKLTFYKKKKTKSRKKDGKRRKQRRKARAGARRVVVKTLATFKPFAVPRAQQAKLTLKVPKVFKPTHVGIVVQEARKISGKQSARGRKRDKEPQAFTSYGAKFGGIYRVKNARYLHTTAPGKKKAKKTKRRKTRRRG